MGGRREVEETKEKREPLGRFGRTLWSSWALISKRAMQLSCACALKVAPSVHRSEGTPSITLRKAANVQPLRKTLPALSAPTLHLGWHPSCLLVTTD